MRKRAKKGFLLHLCEVTNIDKLNWGTGIQDTTWAGRALL